MMEQARQTNTQVKPQQQALDEGIDPIKSAVNGDIFPLIAALDHLQLDTLVDPLTPLSHYICTLYIPLETLLKDRPLPMTKNAEGRTPLSFAIKAKDALATYYCLQQPHQLNTRSTHGLTPAMEALRSGFRIGFLLCVHYGHVTNDLANVAAENNDIWALKFLKHMDIPLNEKDLKGVTPLESAVANYSYECIDYLAKLYPKEIKMDTLGKLAKSRTIFSNLKQIKYGGSEKSTILEESFIKQTGFLILLFFLINSFPKFSDLLYLNFMLLVELCLLIIYYNAPNPPKKPQKNILKTVEPFIKTQLPEICPICVQVKRSNVDHCPKCGVCIQGFHFHRAICTSRCNQVRWAAKEILWLVILRTIISNYTEISQQLLTSGWKYFETFSILYTQSSFLLNDFFLYTVCFILYINQILKTFLIFYIVTSGKTYQQVMNSQKYQSLYRPILITGNYYNRPINCQDYTLEKGVRRAISNTVKFLFE